MLRSLVEEIILFFVPFALFAFWLLATKRNPLDIAHWSGARFALTVAGLVLVIASLIVAGVLAPREQGGYTPPTFVDGELRPGRFGDKP